MAETYKGLTIRIGGDTTSLRNALKSVDGAVRSTQQQLSKIGRALKVDPSSTKAVTSQLDLMGNKAVELNRRFSELKDALRQVGSQKVTLNTGESERTVKELAEGTRDAAQRAGDALRTYNRVNAELEKMYTSINLAAKASGKFADGFDLRTVVTQLDNIEQYLVDTGAATTEQLTRLRELRSAWADAFDENEIAKAVLRMRELETETTSTEAAAKGASASYAELAMQANRVKVDSSAEQRLESIAKASANAEERLERARKALEMDPSNVEAAVVAFRSLSDAVRLSEDRTEALRAEVDGLRDKGFDKVADGMDNLSQRAQEARERFSAISDEMKQLEGSASAIRAEMKLFDEGGISDERYEELNDELRETESRLASVRAEQQRAAAEFESFDGAEQYEKANLELSESISKTKELKAVQKGLTGSKGISSNSLMEMGMTLSTSVTPAIISAGYAAIESAKDIDSAYRDMRKTVDGTEEQFEDLRQAAIDFSTTHVTSADQILSIQAIGGELGIAVEDLKTFAETVSNIEVATDLGAEDAATALGQLDNIMSDLDGSTMPAFADALVRLGNNGASTESQIVDIAKRIGAMGSIVGMSTPEVLAWASSIASTGQNAEAAGTAISNTMSDIEAAVAAGSDSLQQFADVSGMSAQQFADTWNSDPSAAMKSFIEGLVRIEDGGGSANATLQNMGITAVRQQQAIQGLMQTIGGLDDNLAMSRDAWNGVSDQWGEAGDAAREADAKAEGFSGSLQRLMNMAQALGSELGESLTPFIDGLADNLQGLAEWFSDLPDSTKQAIAGVAAFVAALGPAMLVIRAFRNFGDDLSAMFTGTSTVLQAIGRLASGQKAAAAASTGLAKGLGTVADAATGVASGAGGAASVLSGLKGGLIGLGVAVAGVGIAALIQHFNEMAEQERLAERATTGLAEACKVANGSFDDMSESSEDVSQKVDSIVEAGDDATQRLADLADEFDQLNASTNATINRLNDARSAISLFDGRADLTQEQVAQLKTAIDYLNDSCGSNYEVVRQADGSYQVMEDGAKAAKNEILGLIDSMKLQAQVAAQQKKLEGLYEEQATELDHYNEAVEERNKLQNNYDEFVDKHGGTDAAKQTADLVYGDELEELNTEVEESRERLDGLESNIDSVSKSIDNMGSSMSEASDSFKQFVDGSVELNTVFDGDADAMADFTDALKESGVSLETFSSMSAADIIDLAQRWKSGGGDIADVLAEMGIEAQGAAESISEALSSIDGGIMSEALGAAGIGLDEFSQKMEDAGISATQLREIGSDEFARLLASCGGDLTMLTAMLQTYNSEPIYNKDGSININDVQLHDAFGNIYIWNGQQLKTLDGNIVIQTQQFEDTEGMVYRWNEQGQLQSLDGSVTISGGETLQTTIGEIEVYNGYALNPQKGEVYIQAQELYDCNNAMVDYNGTTLNTIPGQVDVDYQDVLDAMSYIDQLKAKKGTVTVTVKTVYQTEGSPSAPASSGGGKSGKSFSPASAGIAGQSPVLLASAANAAYAAPVPRARAGAADVSGAVQAASYVAASDRTRREYITLGLTRTLAQALSEAGSSRTTNVTIDGSTATTRVQSLVMELLEELAPLGVM